MLQNLSTLYENGMVGSRSDRKDRFWKIFWIFSGNILGIICDVLDFLQLIKTYTRKELYHGDFCGTPVV